ncbi:hypothetical protein VTN00DRAFT_2983 [Thermoascus crustaceus]|uniref:uncharacterized protein n=1 Tax=Thermoascus crustaceus TaxID=5088 RepID=UPI0037446E95
MPSQVLKYALKLANKRVLILGGTLRESYPELTAKQSVTTHVCDLSDTSNLERNLDSLLKAATTSGKLNHIVFTAGDALKLPGLSDLNVDIIQQAGVVRFVAPLLLAKLLPKYMDLTVQNSFTMTSGSNTVKPSPGWALMSGWGGAVEGVMRGLAVDLKPLRVNIVSPGAVYTEILSGIAKDNLEGVLQHFRDTSTTGTVGRPEDLAESYIYVMKDQFITGSIVESNGGRLLV